LKNTAFQRDIFGVTQKCHFKGSHEAEPADRWATKLMMKEKQRDAKHIELALGGEV
jgi:hypothetical protein